jgi:hypothetical protein
MAIDSQQRRNCGSTGDQPRSLLGLIPDGISYIQRRQGELRRILRCIRVRPLPTPRIIQHTLE